jgi:NitT/TauT family transport system permease protein
VPGLDAAGQPPAWLRLASLAGFLLLWQLAAAALDRPELPSPGAVLETLREHLASGELARHLGVTLARVAAAFVLALGIGAGLGILMGRSRRADLALDGLLVLALNVPALVTIILCYVWFGLTEVAAVTAVALNKIPTVVVTVREGARAADGRLLEVAYAFRVGPWLRFRRVFLPQLYPYLMASARAGLALIWKIVLVVELLGRSDGVGFQLGTFFQFFDIRGVLAYTLAFAGVVYAIEGLVLRPLDRRLARWRA